MQNGVVQIYIVKNLVMLLQVCTIFCAFLITFGVYASSLEGWIKNANEASAVNNVIKNGNSLTNMAQAASRQTDFPQKELPKYDSNLEDSLSRGFAWPNGQNDLLNPRTSNNAFGAEEFLQRKKLPTENRIFLPETAIQEVKNNYFDRGLNSEENLQTLIGKTNINGIKTFNNPNYDFLFNGQSSNSQKNKFADALPQFSYPYSEGQSNSRGFHPRDKNLNPSSRHNSNVGKSYSRKTQMPIKDHYRKRHRHPAKVQSDTIIRDYSNDGNDEITLHRSPLNDQKYIGGQNPKKERLSVNYAGSGFQPRKETTEDSRSNKNINQDSLEQNVILHKEGQKPTQINRLADSDDNIRLQIPFNKPNIDSMSSYSIEREGNIRRNQGENQNNVYSNFPQTNGALLELDQEEESRSQNPKSDFEHTNNFSERKFTNSQNPIFKRILNGKNSKNSNEQISYANNYSTVSKLPFFPQYRQTSENAFNKLYGITQNMEQMESNRFRNDQGKISQIEDKKEISPKDEYSKLNFSKISKLLQQVSDLNSMKQNKNLGKSFLNYIKPEFGEINNSTANLIKFEQFIRNLRDQNAEISTLGKLMVEPESYTTRDEPAIIFNNQRFPTSGATTKEYTLNSDYNDRSHNKNSGENNKKYTPDQKAAIINKPRSGKSITFAKTEIERNHGSSPSYTSSSNIHVKNHNPLNNFVIDRISSDPSKTGETVQHTLSNRFQNLNSNKRGEDEDIKVVVLKYDGGQMQPLIDSLNKSNSDNKVSPHTELKSDYNTMNRSSPSFQERTKSRSENAPDNISENFQKDSNNLDGKVPTKNPRCSGTCQKLVSAIVGITQNILENNSVKNNGSTSDYTNEVIDTDKEKTQSNTDLWTTRKSALELLKTDTLPGLSESDDKQKVTVYVTIQNKDEDNISGKRNLNQSLLVNLLRERQENESRSKANGSEKIFVSSFSRKEPQAEKADKINRNQLQIEEENFSQNTNFDSFGENSILNDTYTNNLSDIFTTGGKQKDWNKPEKLKEEGKTHKIVQDRNIIEDKQSNQTFEINNAQNSNVYKGRTYDIQEAQGKKPFQSNALKNNASEDVSTTDHKQRLNRKSTSPEAPDKSVNSYDYVNYDYDSDNETILRDRSDRKSVKEKLKKFLDHLRRYHQHDHETNNETQLNEDIIQHNINGENLTFIADENKTPDSNFTGKLLSNHKRTNQNNSNEYEKGNIPDSDSSNKNLELFSSEFNHPYITTPGEISISHEVFKEEDNYIEKGDQMHAINDSGESNIVQTVADERKGERQIIPTKIEPTVASMENVAQASSAGKNDDTGVGGNIQLIKGDPFKRRSGNASHIQENGMAREGAFPFSAHNDKLPGKNRERTARPFTIKETERSDYSNSPQDENDFPNNSKNPRNNTITNMKLIASEPPKQTSNVTKNNNVSKIDKPREEKEKKNLTKSTENMNDMRESPLATHVNAKHSPHRKSRERNLDNVNVKNADNGRLQKEHESSNIQNKPEVSHVNGTKQVMKEADFISNMPAYAYTENNLENGSDSSIPSFQNALATNNGISWFSTERESPSLEKVDALHDSNISLKKCKENSKAESHEKDGGSVYNTETHISYRDNYPVMVHFKPLPFFLLMQFYSSLMTNESPDAIVHDILDTHFGNKTSVPVLPSTLTLKQFFTPKLPDFGLQPIKSEAH